MGDEKVHDDERAGMSSGGAERTDHSAGGSELVKEGDRRNTATFGGKMLIWILLAFIIGAAVWIVLASVLAD